MTVKELIDGMEASGTIFTLSTRFYQEAHDEDFVKGYDSFTQGIDSAFKQQLLRNCGSMETVVPSVEQFIDDFYAWSIVKLFMWRKMIKSLIIKYNLIHNTDRTEEKTLTVETTVGGSSTDKFNGSGSSNSSRTANNADTSNGETLHQISAANQTDFHNKERDAVTSNVDMVRDEHSESASQSEEEVERSHDQHTSTTATNKTRAYGNIGVTTNQQMLRQEFELAQIDVVKIMVDDFKKEFCLMIY